LYFSVFFSGIIFPWTPDDSISGTTSFPPENSRKFSQLKVHCLCRFLSFLLCLLYSAILILPNFLFSIFSNKSLPNLLLVLFCNLFLFFCLIYSAIHPLASFLLALQSFPPKCSTCSFLQRLLIFLLAIFCNPPLLAFLLSLICNPSFPTFYYIYILQSFHPHFPALYTPFPLQLPAFSIPIFSVSFILLALFCYPSFLLYSLLHSSTHPVILSFLLYSAALPSFFSSLLLLLVFTFC
jgi:hypothetical protein